MNRRPSNPQNVAWMVIGGAVVMVLFMLWSVRQLASFWDTGDWIRGSGANPLSMVRQMFDGTITWNGTHIFFTALFTIAFMAGGIVLVLWFDRRARHRRSLAYRSKRVGNGSDMSLEAAKRKADVGGLLGVAGVAAGLLMCKVLHSGQAIYTAWREGLLIIMGPGGGKTRGFATPMILEAPGTVFATSNKRDIADQVRLGREKVGRFLCFDPQSIAGYHTGTAPWWWNVLSYVRNETRALSLASMFAKAGAGSGKKQSASDSDFFESSGKHLLARLLLAAAVSGRYIDQVFLWLSDDQEREPVALLEKAGLSLSAKALASDYNAATEQRSGVFATARSFVEWLENREALEWIMPMGPDDDRPEFHPEQFVRDRTATLVALSKEGDGSLGPVTSALTKAVLDAAEEYANECGGRVPVPIMMMLDEAANCAPIPDLPAKYSFYGGMGVFVVTILQTPHQGVAVWGETGWKQLWDAATIRVIGSGFKDMAMARDLASQSGKYDNTRWNISGSGAGRNSSSHTSREDKIDPDDITNLAPGQIYVVHNNGSAPFFGKSIPIQDRPEIKLIVDQSLAKYGPKAKTVAVTI